MENPETFCRRSIHLADQMAGNPAADRRRGGMEPQCLLQYPHARLIRRNDFVGRKVHHRGEAKISGDTGIRGTTVWKHERLTGRERGVCYHGISAEARRRAVSLVMRAKSKSMETDILVSHTVCDTPNKGLDIAACELPLSTAEIIVTSAVSVPV